MSDTWTIGELAERAATTLRPTPQRPNGRVRDVPNERLIRWYTTIGLVDPPLTRRGRVALYGRRHLLQLIAVKRRQADGRSIAEIQAELAGATDTTLEAIASIPTAAGPAPGGADAEGSPHPPAGFDGNPGPPAARPRFWARPAAEAVPALADGAVPVSLPDAPGGGPPPGPRPAGLVHGVRLAPGVTLLLDGPAPSPGDVAALQEAAAPLLTVLRDRGLSGSAVIHPIHHDLDRSPSEGMQT
ncbi:MerR family transcriptional regulator [Sphaerisporangium sp. NPDC088356]|uniref:MerR family transcriptional regulator n=1 Tax=Sphaerisporangium sp. NPDC088356 TaxID=3154871 RepID=UPI003445FCCA